MNLQLQHLNYLERASAVPAADLLNLSRRICKQLGDLPAEDQASQPALDLFIAAHSLILRLFAAFGAATLPRNRLLKTARQPLALIRWSFERHAITRDADSFIPAPKRDPLASILGACTPLELNSIVPQKSTQKPASTHRPPVRRPKCTPAPAFPLLDPPELIPFSFGESLSPSHPDSPLYSCLPSELSAGLDMSEPLEYSEPPSFLTDEQWFVLAPLLPGDDDLDQPPGDPPALIAMNRWQFTGEIPGELSAFTAIQEYGRLMEKCRPSEPYRLPLKRKRIKPGRPQTPPRLLLDAIFWKLSTGSRWDEFPAGFPPYRCCQKYYRRLFRSGRLFTLLSALYNHLDLSGASDLRAMVQTDQLALTARDRVIIPGGVPPTWQLHTAQLFLQLAQSAARAKEREKKANHKPLDPRFSDPDFGGLEDMANIQSLRQADFGNLDRIDPSEFHPTPPGQQASRPGSGNLIPTIKLFPLPSSTSRPSCLRVLPLAPAKPELNSIDPEKTTQKSSRASSSAAAGTVQSQLQTGSEALPAPPDRDEYG